VPFAALSDGTGRPLIETFAIGIAGSLTSLMFSSAKLTAFVADGVLTIGDGHDPLVSGLPRLKGADSEAIEVGRIYASATTLTGAQATSDRLFSGAYHVIHFAGHTIVNPQFPLLSRLLLAPDT